MRGHGEVRSYVECVLAAGNATGEKVHAVMGDKNTNWQDLVFRTAISHDHNVSLTGNINDRMPYRASVGYTNQQGTLETSKYERRPLHHSLTPHSPHPPRTRPTPDRTALRLPSRWRTLSPTASSTSSAETTSRPPFCSSCTSCPSVRQSRR